MASGMARRRPRATAPSLLAMLLSCWPLTHSVSPSDFDSIEVWPTRAPTKKEAADSGASLEVAMTMPWFPRHELMCNRTKRCRPGEGNTKGYRFWGQPYIHREEYVQSRRRQAPHEPNPKGEYSRLTALARHVHRDGLVIMAAADWDFRRIILNWFLHARRLEYTNALVLSMDTQLHTELHQRGIPSFDDSANLDDWNTTCLQRHIQRVRTERVLAIAALVAGGFDVLHTDATVVFVRDVMPVLRCLSHRTYIHTYIHTYIRDVMPILRALPPSVDMVTQRHECPPDVKRSTGSGVNPGFLYVRASKTEAVVSLMNDAIKRGAHIHTCIHTHIDERRHQER